MSSRPQAPQKDGGSPEHVLPDILAHELSVVFCGTAAGTVSATLRQYYAHPQNKFWRVLCDVKLTPRPLKSSEYRELLQFGIGLTDIAKQTFGMDSQLPRGSLGADAVLALRKKIEKYRPANLAFTSLTGGRKFLGANTKFGLQSAKIGETAIWVLPSPSPAAHWNWDEHLHVWQALADHVHSSAKSPAQT
jgi:TDG/mug DNA glycosylase family protein